MNKVLFISLFFISLSSFAQVGIGSNTPHMSSILDLTSTTKGFLPPRLTNVQKAAIISPVAGLLVWCTDCSTNGLMQVYNGLAWTNFNGVVTNTLTTNGTAEVSSYSCATANSGTITTGVAVTGVTQTLTALVTSIGNYNIYATSNGITFTGSGTFTNTGAQNIVLTASGTPLNAGVSVFELNTIPNCSFNRTVN